MDRKITWKSNKAVDGKRVGPNTSNELELGETCYAGLTAERPYWELDLNNMFGIHDVSVYGRNINGLGKYVNK